MPSIEELKATGFVLLDRIGGLATILCSGHSSIAAVVLVFIAQAVGVVEELCIASNRFIIHSLGHEAAIYAGILNATLQGLLLVG